MRHVHSTSETSTHMHSHNTVETTGFVIRWAKFYDPLVWMMALGRASQLRQQSVALAKINAGDVVLDVGCGTGDLALAAQPRVGATGKVCGIDPSREMIAVAEQKAAKSAVMVDWRVGVIEALPYADNSFDVVLSSLMMHHLPAPIKEQGLAEIFRVLRPGGRLLIVDFKRPTSVVRRMTTTALWHGSLRIGVQDLVANVQSAGFTLVDQGNTGVGPIGYLLAQKVSTQ